ncbi:MAG: hypothetical protein WC360_09200, partial [Opitutales bacterium]
MNKDGIVRCHEVYLFGMVVLSTIHRLVGNFPVTDTYGEIDQTHSLPGGEAGNSATVLNAFGYGVKLDGPFLGRRTRGPVRAFYEGIGVDCSGMECDDGCDGVEDLVIVAGNSRTVFGRFAAFFSGGRRWSVPDEAAIASASIVGLDPFFYRESELTAEFCVKHGVPYVTLDCAPDSFMCKNAAAVVISGEYIRDKYPEANIDGLFELYASRASGLVIFTFGSNDIMYGRKGSAPARMKPLRVDAKSTLGAGDTFR